MTKLSKQVWSAALILSVFVAVFAPVLSLAINAPFAQTNPATGITQSGATLNGYVDPQGGNTTYWFEYGNTPSLGQMAGNQSATFTSSQNVSFGLNSLNQNTAYYFRLVAQSQYGTTQGNILSFTTTYSGGGSNGNAPIVQTNYATNLSQNSATVNGQINPNGANTTYWFEFGQSSSLGQMTGSQSLGSYSGSITVTGYISNLIPNMNYYFRVVGQNQYGISYGSIYNFTTPNGYGGGGGYYGNCYNSYNSAPCAQTLQPTNISGTTALFNGVVNPNGADATVWFEYGQNSGSFNYTTNSNYVTANSSNYNFTAGANNLQPNTTYYVRAAARNNYGTTYGQSYQFVTTGSGNNGYSGTSLPLVITKAATVVTKTSALLNGSANPANSYGTAWFEYGLSATLGLRTTAQTISSGNSYVDVSFAVGGLAPGTTYYYRAVSQNTQGTSYGSILTLRTASQIVTPPAPSNPPAPVIPPAPTPVNNPNVTIQGTSCLNLAPTLGAPLAGAGDEATYSLDFRNDCGFALANTNLKIILPSESQFESTNYVYLGSDANTISYNLGIVPIGYEGKLEVKNKINSNVAIGSVLVYGATANFNDAKNKSYSNAAYLTAEVSKGTAGVGGTASLLSAFGSLGWIWLLIVFVILFAVYWVFFRKEKKSAVQKIQQSITG